MKSVISARLVPKKCELTTLRNAFYCKKNRPSLFQGIFEKKVSFLRCVLILRFCFEIIELIMGIWIDDGGKMGYYFA